MWVFHVQQRLSTAQDVGGVGCEREAFRVTFVRAMLTSTERERSELRAVQWSRHVQRWAWLDLWKLNFEL